MQSPEPRQPDSRKVLLKAMAVLVMFAIAVLGMCYAGWLLWTLPAKPQ